MADLQRHVEAFLQRWPTGRLRVGYSGGRDSTVLLALLAASPAARARDLRAIHVDHGLHPDSSLWATRSAEFAESIRVPCELVRVDLSTRAEIGIEARARAARREVYARHMDPGDWILLAHHQRDQAETLLLRLFAGAGPAGLGGMAAVTQFAVGRMGRPLLSIASAEIQNWAEAQHLHWIEDPANRDHQHDRSWLREALLPPLRERVPVIDQRLARTADWLRQLSGLLGELARIELDRRSSTPDQLELTAWFEQPEPLRFELLAAWLARLDLPRPGVVAFGRIEHDLIGASPDAEPQIPWGGGLLRRYRQRMYWLPEQQRSTWPARMDGVLGQPLRLPDRRELISEPVPGERVEPGPFQVSRRVGGERFRPDARRPSQTLKHLLQDLVIPPWRRQQLLLIWRGEELAAVLDDEDGHALLHNEAMRQWRFRIGDQGLRAEG
jgi:tRNA(Ile)-lysidine synthase